MGLIWVLHFQNRFTGGSQWLDNSQSMLHFCSLIHNSSGLQQLTRFQVHTLYLLSSLPHIVFNGLSFLLLTTDVFSLLCEGHHFPVRFLFISLSSPLLLTSLEHLFSVSMGIFALKDSCFFLKIYFIIY